VHLRIRLGRALVKGSNQAAFGQHERDAQNRQLNDEANDKNGENGRVDLLQVHRWTKPGDQRHQAHHQARWPWLDAAWFELGEEQMDG
jgi:hypothetical protein